MLLLHSSPFCYWCGPIWWFSLHFRFLQFRRSCCFAWHRLNLALWQLSPGEGFEQRALLRVLRARTAQCCPVLFQSLWSSPGAIACCVLIYPPYAENFIPHLSAASQVYKCWPQVLWRIGTDSFFWRRKHDQVLVGLSEPSKLEVDGPALAGAKDPGRCRECHPGHGFREVHGLC